MALADRTLHKAFWWTPPCPCYAGLHKTPLSVDKLRSRKVFLSFANATVVFHNGEMPIPGGLVHLRFSSTAEFGMAKPRICGRFALYEDLYRRHRILSRASSSISMWRRIEHVLECTILQGTKLSSKQFEIQNWNGNFKCIPTWTWLQIDRSVCILKWT